MDHSKHLQPSRRRPRVLFANATADVGGAEQVILSLADRLPALGFDVSYALLRPGPLAVTMQKRGLDVHVFPEDFRYRDLASVRRCIRWLTSCISATKANLLHSNLTAHLIGGWAARRVQIPEVWHLHDYPFRFDPIHTLNRLIPSDFYIFTTDFLKSGERFLARRPHAVIKPNCIDVETLRAQPTIPAVWERLNVEPQTYFLNVARLQQHKGHEYLLEAAAIVSRKYPNIKFIIAGRAKGAEQESYLARLRIQAEEAGLSERIVFTGFVPEEEMASLFRGAIGLVHPAITEGYGLVLLEAMAHQVPVVAAAASGPAEIIQHQRNGILVPVRNSADLSSAMMLLIENQDLANALRAQGAHDVEGMSVQAMAEEIAAIYREILGNA